MTHPVSDSPTSATQPKAESFMDWFHVNSRLVGIGAVVVLLAGAVAWYIPRAREMEEDYASLYPDPFEGVEARDLAGALMELLIERASDHVVTDHIAPIRISVAERIVEVRARLAADGKTKFSALVADCSSKLEVIATFLAILELFKRREVTLRQRRLFGDIEIQKLEAQDNVA